MGSINGVIMIICGWSSWEPEWSGASGSGDEASEIFTSAGTNYIVSAECGNTKERKEDVLKMDILYIDATNAVEPAKVWCRILPSNAILPFISFIAPGIEETKFDLKNDFYFTYNQFDMTVGTNLFKMLYLGEEEEFCGYKVPLARPKTEIAIGWVVVDPNLPPVPYAITHEVTAERFYNISYSIELMNGSHTIHIGSSDVMVETDENHPIGFILERHYYQDNMSIYGDKYMTLVTGSTLPPITSYRKFFESSDTFFTEPGNNLRGVAKISSIGFDEGGTIVYPILLNNSDVIVLLE